MKFIKNYKKFRDRKQFRQALSFLSLLTLTACSSALDNFDSEATKGVGAKSISEVNAMIDQGKIADLKNEVDQAAVVLPVIVQNPIAIAHPETIVLSDHSIIQRQPEQPLRVWFAPFQDLQGNFHEASVVHTILRPSFWQVNAVQLQDRKVPSDTIECGLAVS